METVRNKQCNKGLLILSFLFMVLIATMITPSADAYAASKTGTVKVSTLNLRQKADTSSKVVKKLKKGTTVTILSTKGEWYKVKASGKTGYVSSSYITVKKAGKKTGYAECDDLNLRKSASASSKILMKFQRGDSMTVLSTKGDWVKVKVSGKTGYVHKSYVTYTKPSKKAKTTGSDIVAYAKKFVGNPYRYGGTSLTNGTDCSGFTQGVFRHFGISLPRSSSQQRSVGTKVSSLSKAKAGDLICYSGHVAIYMGNNKIVHAANSRDGIKIGKNAQFTRILSIRRLL